MLKKHNIVLDLFEALNTIKKNYTYNNNNIYIMPGYYVIITFDINLSIIEN